MGVNKVKGAREPAPFGITDRIGPAGDGCQIVVISALQKIFQVGFGSVGNEMSCYISSGDVAKA